MSRKKPVCPTVANPLHTLLSMLLPERVYAVLDLRDAFFSIPLSKLSQPIFTFECADPELRISGQLTWTGLPQGFSSSPTIFEEAFNGDLSLFCSEYPEVTLLQDVDDLLLGAKKFKDCLATRGLFKNSGSTRLSGFHGESSDLLTVGHLFGI